MCKFFYFATAALMLAGCSRQTTLSSTAPVAQTPASATVPQQIGYASSSSQQPASAAPQQALTQPATQPVTTPPADAYGQNPPLQSTAAPAPAAATDAATLPPETASAPAPGPGTTPAYDATIPAGTRLRVRLDQSLGTKRDRSGERFYASLAAPVVVHGRTILPVGTRFIGHLTQSKPSGRLKGRAVIAVRLDRLDAQGRQYPVTTSSITFESHNRKGHDLKWIGGIAGVGAAIGAIAGGGTGALIGAGAGAGAGTAGAARSHKQLRLSAETPLTFRLTRPIQL
ncbi:MAG TPA: hypothetical protein VHW24_19705 [Bryobacteraceae bacterium]|jgi:hypothetical protein|nr:hypothetical protein [Bryobacteraceae bacterium]